MLAVPIALSGGTVDALADKSVDAALKAAPVWILIVVGLLVPSLEGIVWTLCFVEGADAAFRRPRWGAFGGVVAYGMVYHSSADARTVLAASWVAVVANLSYLALRKRSRIRALLWVMGLRWTFVGFALLAYRGVV